jgi:hypothetical protein
MNPSPAHSDVAKMLELFGYSADDVQRDAMIRQIRDIEHSARCLMRTHLRPREFAEVEAVAQACAAAHAILAPPAH